MLSSGAYMTNLTLITNSAVESDGFFYRLIGIFECRSIYQTKLRKTALSPQNSPFRTVRCYTWQIIGLFEYYGKSNLNVIHHFFQNCTDLI